MSFEFEFPPPQLDVILIWKRLSTPADANQPAFCFLVRYKKVLLAEAIYGSEISPRRDQLLVSRATKTLAAPVGIAGFLPTLYFCEDQLDEQLDRQRDP